MKSISKTRTKLLVLFVVVCQMLSVSCSRKQYAVSSFHGISRQSEEKKLRYFLDGGTEKKIDAHNTSADEILKTAKKYIGVPHCMGGTTRKCMDCSGLVFRVFAEHDIKLPHSSEEIARYGKLVSEIDKLRKGDLVFFIRSYKTHDFITHTGIYTGNNQFIHTSSKSGVTITSINDRYWKEKFIFGTRVLQ